MVKISEVRTNVKEHFKTNEVNYKKAAAITVVALTALTAIVGVFALLASLGVLGGLIPALGTIGALGSVAMIAGGGGISLATAVAYLCAKKGTTGTGTLDDGLEHI